MKCFVIAAVISSAIALWLQSGAFRFANGIKSCAAYSNDFNVNCDGVVGYECFGEAGYYGPARHCLDTFFRTDQDCACISTERNECYDFEVPDCSQLYTQLPKTIRTSYYLIVMILSTSSALLLTIALSIRSLGENQSTEGYTVVAPLQVFESEDDGL